MDGEEDFIKTFFFVLDPHACWYPLLRLLNLSLRDSKEKMYAITVCVVVLLATSALSFPHHAWDHHKESHALRFDANDDSSRRQVFEHNMQTARDLTATNPKAHFGPNIFSHLDADEFRRTHLNSAPHIQQGIRMHREGKLPFMKAHDPRVAMSDKPLPVAFDWRLHGAVTPVKNQGDCGSCWSFSTTGNIEGQWFLAGHNLTSFSEQNFVSCDTLLSFGCHGGFSWIAYSWAINYQNGSIYTEESYPYVSGTNGTVPSCDVSKAVVGGRILGGKLLSPWDVEGMKMFIANEGPLSVAVDATTWQHYTGGIMTTCEAFLPNHEVLIVGYGSEAPSSNATSSTEYWIVKNSWSTSWGESGYLRVEAGKNLCQIELLANSAVVAANAQ